MNDFKHKFIFDMDAERQGIGFSKTLTNELSGILEVNTYKIEWTWVLSDKHMSGRKVLLCVKLQDTEQLSIVKLRYSDMECKE